MFCHDHSNAEGSGCARPHCRYVHASAEEEREYRQSGYLPPHVRDQTIRKGIAVDLPTLYGRKPICKENLKVGLNRLMSRPWVFLTFLLAPKKVLSKSMDLVT